MKKEFTRYFAKKAFTLVELLVVLAIVALLASLLFAGLNRALKDAQLAKTIHNLKVLGQLSALYSGERNGRVVLGKDQQKDQWQVLLARMVPSSSYVAGIDKLYATLSPAPLLKKDFEVFSPAGWKTTSQFWETGFGINMRPGLPTVNKDNTQEPGSETYGMEFVLSAITHHSRRPFIFPWPKWNAYPNHVNSTNFELALMGHTRLPVLYFDGHVSTLPEQNGVNLLKDLMLNPETASP